MIVCYVLDQAQWSVWFAGDPYAKRPKTRKSVKAWCESENADLAFNFALFNMNNAETVTYVHAAYGDIGYGGASGIVNLGECWCKGYSNGIVSGGVVVNAPLGGRRTRTGIGLTGDDKVIVAQSNTKLTEKQFCTQVNSFVRSQGHMVKLFVLEDGGGSTAHYSAVSRLGFAPEGGRAVPTVICAKRKSVQPITRTLQRGCKGEDVRLLQACLGGIEVDGSFGAGSTGTRQRVIAAQKKFGLKADGIANAALYKRMGL